MNLFLTASCGLLISLLIAWLLVRFENVHAHFSHDHTASGPQKFHSLPTPRIGGIPIACGFVGSLGVAVALGLIEGRFALAFCLAVLPAFASGIVEDLTKKIGPDIRLWASFLSALISMYFFDAVVDRSELPFVDALLAWYPIALIFTTVGIGGVAHAVNIIDGYNGLASAVSCMMLAAIGWVAWNVGDSNVAVVCACLLSATIGFFRWNFPWGRIFAGDGGAYLWGVAIAILAVLLIHRNPSVSPWFAMAVLIYPVFETLFSIYRRSLRHSASAGMPDAKHLHQLIYRRLLFRGSEFRRPDTRLRTLRNAATAPFLWILALTSILPAILFWQQGAALIGITASFMVLYVWTYRSIVTFRTPTTLRRCGRWISVLALRYYARKAPQ